LPADARQLTVAVFLRTWLENVARTRKRTTHDRYVLLVEKQMIPFIGSLKLCLLSPMHVERLFADLRQAGESAWTIFHVAVVLGTAMKAAVKKKLIAANPLAAVESRPRVEKREICCLDQEQARAFLTEAAGDRLSCLFVLAITSGLREGELFGLKWADIDFTQGFLRVQRTLEEVRGRFALHDPKTTAARRRVDLPKVAISALLYHRRRMLAEGQDVRGGLVFCDRDGSFLRRSNVARRALHPILARAGLPRIRFHDLRHSAASLLLAAGESPKVVQERLGHAKIETTLNIYAHVTSGMQQEAARKLDRLLG
jgi:integrase